MFVLKKRSKGSLAPWYVDTIANMVSRFSDRQEQARHFASREEAEEEMVRFTHCLRDVEPVEVSDE